MPTYAAGQTGVQLPNNSPTGPNMPWQDLLALAAQHGIDVDKLPMAPVERFFALAPPKGLGKDVVAIKVGGRTEYYRVTDRLLYQSLAALRREEMNGFFKAFNGMRQFLSRMIVADPGYMIRNFIRDTISQIVQTDTRSANLALEGLRAAEGVLAGLRHGMAERGIPGGKVDPRALEIMAAGGDTGWYQNAPEDVRKAMEKGLRAGRFSIMSLVNPAAYFRTWEKLGRAAEIGNRIATYGATLKATGSNRDAVFEAMDALDFQLRGSWHWVQQLAVTVPFFNARLQGLYRLGRGVGTDWRKFALKAGILMALTVALAAVNATDDDEENGYGSLPEWMKDAYYVVPLYRFWSDEQWAAIERETGLPRFLLIPKPFEVGAIFGTAPERAIQVMLGNDRPEETRAAAAGIILNTFAFNPLSNPLMLVPIEQWAGQTFFPGGPIESRALQGLPPGQRYTARTSDTARLVGGALDVSPERIEHIVRGYTGTIGMYGLGAMDGTIRFLRGDEAPEVRLDEQPILRSAVVQGPLRTTKWTERFYAIRQLAQEAHNGLRDLEQRVGPEARAARQGDERTARAAALNSVTARQARELGQLRRLEQAVRDISDMEPARRRSVIDDLAGAGLDGIPRDWRGRDSLTPQERRRALNAILQRRNRIVATAGPMEEFVAGRIDQAELERRITRR